MIFAPSMPFSPDPLSAHAEGCAAISPCDGEGDDNKQGREFAGAGDAGVLNIEPTGNQILLGSISSGPVDDRIAPLCQPVVDSGKRT